MDTQLLGLEAGAGPGIQGIVTCDVMGECATAKVGNYRLVKGELIQDV